MLGSYIYEERMTTMSGIKDVTRGLFLARCVTPVMKLTGHRGCINTCSFNPLGDLELTGCDDGCVWLWDIGNRMEKPKLMLRPHKTNVFTTNFLSGNRFLSGGNDATVQVAEILPDGRAMSTVYHEHHIRKVMCSFVIDESTFATCSYDRTVRLFDTRTKYTNQRQIELPALTDADLDYNGMRKLSEDLNEYNIQSQSIGGGLCGPPPCPVDDASLLIDFRQKDSAELFTMDAHPIDRKRFITSGNDGTVRLFDLRNLRKGIVGDRGFCVNHKYGTQMNVTGAVFDETGQRIAATVIGGNIHVLDANASIDLTTLQPLAPRRRGRSIDLSPFISDDGQISAAELMEFLTRAQQRAEEEEVEEEEQVPGEINGEIATLSGHISEQTIKTCNWYGDYVVTGSDTGSILFYDVKSGGVINICRAHEGNVNVVTVHQEKKLLATSGIDNYSVLWEPRLICNPVVSEVTKEVERMLNEEERSAESGVACNVQ